MSFLFFSKTDKRVKIPFFKPSGLADDASAGSGQDKAGSTVFHPNRKLRFLPHKESLEDLLEKLLLKAEQTQGQARDHYLERMLHFLKQHPGLVNRVPNQYHSNPLELVIKLGKTNIAQELLTLKAQVRPENRNLLQYIKIRNIDDKKTFCLR